MKQLASLLSVWSLCCCFQENLVQSLITKCTSVQMTVKWPNGTFKQCLYCEECHPGRGLYPHKCGDTVTFPVITHCKKCDSGKTFSDTYDTSSCKLCHSCAEHEIVTKNCTLSSDTKCNKTCNSGYFFSKPQQVCKRCSYCCLDGKHEEQPQCINQGLKAVNRYCSPRPDRTCTPLMVSTTTGSVISTEARSSTKHHKIEWILSCTGIGSLFGVILLYCLWRRSKRKIRRQDAQNLSNLDDGCNLRVACDPSKGNQGGLMQEEGSTLQEVQQNDGLIIASAASTARGIPRTGGCKDPVQLVNVPSENFTQRPDRTEEKKADESARVALLADNKDGEDDVSDNIDGKGAQGEHERRGSLYSGLQLLCRRLSPPYHMPYERLPEKDPDQPTEGHSSKDVTIQLVTNGPKVPQAGSRVVFQCTVRECQQVFYRWYKDEQELQEENDSTLILDSVKVQDFGFYKCEVRSDKRYESNVVHLDVTPAEGKSYRNLSEVFDSDLGLKETVANLLEKETNVCRKAYKQVAFHYKMTNIDRLERCKNPGEDVLESLKSTQPDLTVYHFCKVLKGENIRRLDIVNKLVDYLIDRNGA